MCMKSTYWNSVKNRFLSLASTVLQTAVPVAVDVTIVLSVNRTCSIIEQNLSHIYKKTAINSAITLLINTLGILILFFKPVNRTTNLVWWNATTYDSSKKDKTYARIDKEWQKWYFTPVLFAISISLLTATNSPSGAYL